MTQYIGYLALSLNLISMSLKSVLYLRICSLAANIMYVVYGFLLYEPPIFIGCTIAVLLHSYWIYRIIKEEKYDTRRVNKTDRVY